MAKKKAKKSSKDLAPRFGIGEWFGRSFVDMTSAERREYASIAMRSVKEANMPCPFRNSNGDGMCSKKGGVCSLRLYETSDGTTAAPLTTVEGDLRAVCPQRFKQDDAIYSVIGETTIGDSNPRVVNEVRFLQRPKDEASVPSIADVPEEENQNGDNNATEDVGNIDCVLVSPGDETLRWCALEIQAVYFSGASMTSLFRSILDSNFDEIPFPDKPRRPDYRSSGPKRLMPQLQIKVPTLRRWGKKMAIVVDAGFFRSLGRMETVSDLSNADIAWFVAHYDETGAIPKITFGEPVLQTLERAVEGLTGGSPVTLDDFETKILRKLK